jgi:hypothetical protein
MPIKKIFISHISSETELAQSLKNSLKKYFLGLLDIFVSSDKETIQAGTKWLDEVDTALKGADFQIVLCSKESVGRPWVNFEAGAAWIRGIPVIPLCHSGLRLIDLPIPLGMLQAVECSQPDSLYRLYDAVAKTLGVDVPDIDFKQLASELREVEKKYVQARSKLETVENPRILCAASEPYSSQPDIGFDFDVAILESTFPGCVTVERNLSRKKLRTLLTNEDQRFDILHLVLAVNPENGDLIFTPVEKYTHKPTTDSPETLSAEAFASLLLESQTKLVVLATCNALLLGVEVAHITNMAASDTIISAKAAEEWEECFYSLLAEGKSLFKAFELTKLQSEAPIRTIRNRDVIFSLRDT